MTNGLNKKMWLTIVPLIVFLFFSCNFHSVHAVNVDCSAGKHHYTEVIQEATEEEDGQKTYTCNICGYTYSQIIPATGHDWSEWRTDKAATCTEAGLESRTCTRYAHAPHTEERTTPPLGHDYQEKVIPATCEEDEKKVYTCSRCNHTYEEAGEKALGHSYTETILTPADCEVAGEKQYTCERCEDVYTEPIPMRAHAYGEWIIVKEATVDEAGLRRKVCSHNIEHVIEEPIEKLLPEEKRLDEKTVNYVIISVGAAPFSLVGFSVIKDLQVLRWRRRIKKLRLLKMK